MALSAAQYSEMVKIFGQERADEFIKQGETMSAQLIAAGIAYKSTSKQETKPVNSFTAAIKQTMQKEAAAVSQAGKKSYWQALAAGVTPAAANAPVATGRYWSDIARNGKALQAEIDAERERAKAAAAPDNDVFKRYAR